MAAVKEKRAVDVEFDETREAVDDALMEWADARTQGDAERTRTSDELERAYWKWSEVCQRWTPAQVEDGATA
jgi:hypothetical protein